MSFLVRRKTIINEIGELMAWYAHMRDISDVMGNFEDACSFDDHIGTLFVLASNLDMENKVLKRAAEIYPEFSLTRSKEEKDDV